MATTAVRACVTESDVGRVNEEGVVGLVVALVVDLAVVKVVEAVDGGG